MLTFDMTLMSLSTDIELILSVFRETREDAFRCRKGLQENSG